MESTIQAPHTFMTVMESMVEAILASCDIFQYTALCGYKGRSQPFTEQQTGTTPVKGEKGLNGGEEFLKCGGVGWEMTFGKWLLLLFDVVIFGYCSWKNSIVGSVGVSCTSVVAMEQRMPCEKMYKRTCQQGSIMPSFLGCCLSAQWNTLQKCLDDMVKLHMLHSIYVFHCGVIGCGDRLMDKQQLLLSNT
eukprot:15365363-Ditylum_brightwellii.AAC.1